MVREFENKDLWALILGGSSGLGLATAQKLASHGLNICIVHRNRKSEMSTVEMEFENIRKEGVSFLAFNADACKEEEQEAIVEALKSTLGKTGRIHVLVHSLAKGNLKPMVSADQLTLKRDDFRLTIEAMAITLYDWTKLLFDRNLFAADARISSFTSEGNTRAWANYAAVSAAKTALEAITRNIALEFAPFGIKANCIQAGITDTASFRAIPGSKELRLHSLNRNPMKRLTTPKDVADVVYLLCKKEAAWINGSIIPVDGGEHLR
ncbi:MAG: SDR family oxidoreductase [Flavobacteriaceae bacterium]|nr:SDR family oxidoreductase [Flavobacteriaceae bacterium]